MPVLILSLCLISSSIPILLPCSINLSLNVASFISIYSAFFQSAIIFCLNIDQCKLFLTDISASVGAFGNYFFYAVKLTSYERNNFCVFLFFLCCFQKCFKISIANKKHQTYTSTGNTSTCYPNRCTYNNNK